MAHRVARRAEADLDDIWLYVAKESGSLEVANRLCTARVVHGRGQLKTLFGI
ncbi:MAG: hypothetical protein ACRD4G_12920 [Bryobacteraceae bacterium]